ncbi:FliH/SctL family protein [Variovorax sp. ZT5P49]|uniref:FliH/SctL family protein n=1 Tax=Variovorax sp. ZT5P49 TaxID=3443733 RepID=UPI003F4686C3
MNALPPSGNGPTAADAESRTPAIVLRDVVMQGQVALTRPHTRDGRASRAVPIAGPGLVQLPTGPRSASRASVWDTNVAAQSDSRRQAPQVHSELAQAEDEARRRGYEEGFAKGSIEGRARGDEEARQLAAQAADKAARDLEDRAERMTHELKQQAQAGYQARVQVLDGLIASLPAKLDARLAAAEDDMLALCFEVICSTLGESVAQPKALRAQLAQAMEKLRSRQLTAIHMHPEDLAMLQKSQGPEQGLPGGPDVQWIASTEVALGGCILQSPEGGLDARFETQLSALRELLLQTRAAVRLQGV